MICPHCGKEIVIPDYAEPANTAGQPVLNLATTTTVHASYPITHMDVLPTGTELVPGRTLAIDLPIRIVQE